MNFEVKRFDGEDGYMHLNYISHTTLPSGMRIKIEFQEERTSDTYFYSIYLNTMHKRKQEDTTCMQSTGRDGLKGLIWAKQMVSEFENAIRDDIPDMNIIIYAAWDDNRRRNVYQYGLNKLGYKFGMINNKKVLLKKI